MKGIVMEINGKYAILMDRDGCFTKVRNKPGYAVGYEVAVEAVPVPAKSLLRTVSIAAAILLMIGVGTGVYAYQKPYAYIDVDINPSVEITTNWFQRIIQVKAFNTDGENIIRELSLKHQPLDTGINALLDEVDKQGYLQDKEKSAVLFTVSGQNTNDVQEIQKEIREVAEPKVKEINPDAVVYMEEMEITEVEAQQNKVTEGSSPAASPGKLHLIDKLQKVEPDIKPEEYFSKPVKAIMDAVKAARKDEKETSKDTAAEEKADKDQDKNKNKDKNDVSMPAQGTSFQESGSAGNSHTKPNKGHDKETGTNKSGKQTSVEREKQNDAKSSSENKGAVKNAYEKDSKKEQGSQKQDQGKDIGKKENNKEHPSNQGNQKDKKK